MKDCQEITELIERSKLERISWNDRLAIRMHGAICKNCRQYFKDSDRIDELLKSKKKFEHLGEHKFSDEEKAKLKALLQSKSGS